jgi:hypothetical protein
MSSFVRRLQKRIAKSQGFYRSQADVFIETDPRGEQTGRSVGYIHNSDNDRVGLHWPQVAAPTRESKNA